MKTIDINDIKGNNHNTCLRCGIVITPTNDSGWEAFTADGITTQPVCKACDSKTGAGIKSEKANV